MNEWMSNEREEHHQGNKHEASQIGVVCCVLGNEHENGNKYQWRTNYGKPAQLPAYKGYAFRVPAEVNCEYAVGCA